LFAILVPNGDFVSQLATVGRDVESDAIVEAWRGFRIDDPAGCQESDVEFRQPLGRGYGGVCSLEVVGGCNIAPRLMGSKSAV